MKSICKTIYLPLMEKVIPNALFTRPWWPLSSAGWATDPTSQTSLLLVQGEVKNEYFYSNIQSRLYAAYIQTTMLRLES